MTRTGAMERSISIIIAMTMGTRVCSRTGAVEVLSAAAGAAAIGAGTKINADAPADFFGNILDGKPSIGIHYEKKNGESWD